MNDEELKLAILKVLIDYEKEFCSDIPEWKKELRDSSYMEEMEWMSFEQLIDKLDLSIDTNRIKDILKSMDGDVIEMDWDDDGINGIAVTSEGAFYWQMKNY